MSGHDPSGTPISSQREIDENDKQFIEEYRQAFTTQPQWLLSLAGAKEIITEEKDVFIILLILAAIYGFHLWTIPRSREPHYIHFITNYFLPNLSSVVFILIVSYIMMVPFKWEIICFITMATAVASIIQYHPSFWNQMKQSLEATWNRWKPSSNFGMGSNTAEQRDENGASRISANARADAYV